MSQLHQMQLAYVAEEDRILLRMNTRSRQEFRFWITRRYTDLLWRTVTQVVQQREPEVAPIQDELKKATVIQEKHEKAVESSDFETAYQESSYLPLGEAPALLFRAGIKPDAEGRALLCMHPKSGQGIELAMNDQIVHSLCKLLLEATRKANWQLNLKWSKLDPKPNADDEAQSSPDQGLN